MAEQARELGGGSLDLARHLGDALLGEADGGSRDADGRGDRAASVMDRGGEAADAGGELLVVKAVAAFAGELNLALDLAEAGEGARGALGGTLRAGAVEFVQLLAVQEGEQRLARRRAVQLGEKTGARGGAERVGAVLHGDNQRPVVTGDGQVGGLVRLRRELLEHRQRRGADLRAGQ